MKKLISLFTLIIFFCLIIFLSNKTYSASLIYEQEYINYSKTKTLEKNIENESKNLLNNILGLILNNKNVKNEKDIKQYKLEEYNNTVFTNFYYFILAIIISFFLYFIVSRVYFLTYINFVSLISLLFGLFSPIFIMYITKDFANNEIILQFESNSIITSIEKLFLQNNYFVGGIILVFSILFPIIKTVLNIIVLQINNNAILKFLSNILNKISKFSMTDVFVLSIFLVYLTPKEDSMIKTHLEIGFYFFFTYVILSLITAILNNKNK